MEISTTFVDDGPHRAVDTTTENCIILFVGGGGGERGGRALPGTS